MNAVKKTKSTAKSIKVGKPDSTHKMNSLARLFRKTRVEAGYDLENLAQHALISIELVELLESKPETVPLKDLYAVANVLNLDPGVVLELLHSVT